MYSKYEDDAEEVCPVMIKGENIHKTYLFGLQGVAALRGVSLEIKEGQFVMILGNSGGGKTSLLNVLGTIDRQTRGDYKFCNQVIKASTPDHILSEIRLFHIGFVFQTFNLLESLTALENVELPMLLKGDKDQTEIRTRAKELLASVNLSQRLFHYPSQLSGGEQQRVTIARAISNKPSLLLLDQPTGDLDSRSGKTVMRILLKLNTEERMTMVMVTHDVNLKFFAHRVIKVHDGKIVGEEIIDPQIRKSYIAQLSATDDALEFTSQQSETNNINSCIQPESPIQATQWRRPRDYKAVAWLREKKRREQIEAEIKKRISEDIRSGKSIEELM